MPLYLVTMNLNRADPLLPVDQLTRLQAQGKVVSGGYPIGRPAIVLLMDAASEKELYEILEGLPI